MPLPTTQARLAPSLTRRHGLAAPKSARSRTPPYRLDGIAAPRGTVGDQTEMLLVKRRTTTISPQISPTMPDSTLHREDRGCRWQHGRHFRNTDLLHRSARGALCGRISSRAKERARMPREAERPAALKPLLEQCPFRWPRRPGCPRSSTKATWLSGTIAVDVVTKTPQCHRVADDLLHSHSYESITRRISASSSAPMRAYPGTPPA